MKVQRFIQMNFLNIVVWAAFFIMWAAGMSSNVYWSVTTPASNHDFYGIWPYDSDDKRRAGSVLCCRNRGIDMYRCLFAAHWNSSRAGDGSSAGLPSGTRGAERISHSQSAGQSGNYHSGISDYRKQSVRSF